MEGDGRRLVGDLLDVLGRPVGFGTTLSVRHSPQLERKGGREGTVGNLDARTALHFEFDLRRDFGPNDQAAFQVGGWTLFSPHFFLQIAAIYTTIEGKRRVRVLNLRLATSADYEEVYGGVDLSTLVSAGIILSLQSCLQTTHLLKEAAERWAADWSVAEIKEAIFRLVSLALFAYRRRLHGDRPADSLVVPLQLRLLPLFAASVGRSPLLDEREEAVDRRVFLLHAVRRMDAEEAMRFVVPRVVDVRTIADGLPHTRLVRPSFCRLEEGGVFLVENGVDAFLWIDDRTDPEWLREVFGCGEASRLANEVSDWAVGKVRSSSFLLQTAIPALPTRHSLLFGRFWTELNANRSRRLSFRLLFAFSPAARSVRRLLVEDAADFHPAHSTVLHHLHSNILRLLE